jgi:hypothetical protein
MTAHCVFQQLQLARVLCIKLLLNLLCKLRLQHLWQRVPSLYCTLSLSRTVPGAGGLAASAGSILPPDSGLIIITES